MESCLKTVILEDCDDDRFLVEHALRRAGIQFAPTAATSRAELIRALESGPPDVILADCHLPDLEAADTLEIVLRLRPETPVILVTGGLSDGAAAALLRAGAADYVLKDRLARLGPAVLMAVERAAEASRRCAEATKLKEALLGTVDAISRTVEKRDPYTAGHQHRVAELAAAAARNMSLPGARVEGVRLGATIHDIGKICVPAEILSRPGKLTNAEFDIIKTHPEVGYDIVRDIDFPWPVAQMIYQHHERMDGSGYPRGLKGDEILLEARILAVADVVESMTSHRPYRAGLGLDAALQEIARHRGTVYDAAAVDACALAARSGEFTPKA